MAYRSNYKIDRDEFKAEVVATIKEVRTFVAANKVLNKEDEDSLFSCLKYLIDLNGDVNQLLLRWERMNLRIYSLLTRMEMKSEDMEEASEHVRKEAYIDAIKNDHKDYVSKAMADTCAAYKASSEAARPYRHMVKFLERTYKLSESSLRVLEHISNNMRQENRKPE